MSQKTPHDITLLLERMQHGDLEARARLITLVYPQLKRLAAARMRGERVGHSLQPTALVHEAFIRLAGTDIHWRSRGQFFGLVAEIMRNVLVDAARRQRTAKRGGDLHIVDAGAGDADAAVYEQPDVVLDVDRLLTKLQALDHRQAQIVELRYFAGLTEPEVSAALGISERTVKRDWHMARAWMRKEMGRQ